MLLIFDQDPAVSAGGEALARWAHRYLIGKVNVETADWHLDSNGGMAYIFDNPVPFHTVNTLYFAWFHEDATGLNSTAADEEMLHFDFWYRRDS